MDQKFAILLPLFAAACAMPDLTGGPADDPAWFDSRIEGEGRATQAPEIIPSTTITPDESAERSAAMQSTLEAGDAIRTNDRASVDDTDDADEFADAARERANPPPRPD